MTRELLRYCPAVLAWAALVYKLSALRRDPKTPSIRAYWIALLVVSLAMTLLLPPVYLAFDRLTGVPNLARLLVHSQMLIAGWFVQLFFFHLNYGEARVKAWRNRDLWVLVLALLLLTGFFGLSRTEEDAFTFNSRYADTPFIPEYRIVFLFYVGYTLVNLARLSWRYANISKGRPLLYLGLRFVTIGGCFGFGYVVHGILYLVLRRFGIDYTAGHEEVISDVLIAGTIGMIVLGSTMPLWGQRVGLTALYRWTAQYRSLRTLYPLWHALCRETPEIALVPSQTPVRDALAVRDLGFRLYRRVIEIRDGCLALRPFGDPSALEYARTLGIKAGLAAEEQDAMIEAAGIAVALRRKAVGQSMPRYREVREPSGGIDVGSEVAALERIAYHLKHSSIVREVLAFSEREGANKPLHIGRMQGES